MRSSSRASREGLMISLFTWTFSGHTTPTVLAAFLQTPRPIGDLGGWRRPTHRRRRCQLGTTLNVSTAEDIKRAVQGHKCMTYPRVFPRSSDESCRTLTTGARSLTSLMGENRSRPGTGPALNMDAKGYSSPECDASEQAVVHCCCAPKILACSPAPAFSLAQIQLLLKHRNCKAAMPSFTSLTSANYFPSRLFVTRKELFWPCFN